MKVEISHNVDRGGDQVYNFLTYDFLIQDGIVRARAYVDEMGAVSILGRLNADGSVPAVVADFQAAVLAAGRVQESQLEAAQAAFEAMDARRASGFDDIVGYLTDRFSQITLMGPRGPEIIRGMEQRP